MLTPHSSHKALAAAIGVDELFFKREDLHPYGSHKGRSIPVMIQHYYDKGDRRFAVSSSGNAALAAALYIRGINAKNPDPAELEIFVGRHIAPKKLEKIKHLCDDRVRILIKERPLQALTQAIQEGMRSLRQSTDDYALMGYKALAKELTHIEGIGAIFIGTSSGTTAQALAQYMIDNDVPIQIHIVQTSSCHPLADAFDTFEIPEEVSKADAIVDRTAERKTVLIPLIEKTGGRGWCAKNEDIEIARELVAKNTPLTISANSALSVVGAMQAAYMGWEFPGSVVCITCGD